MHHPPYRPNTARALASENFGFVISMDLATSETRLLPRCQICYSSSLDYWLPPRCRMRYSSSLDYWLPSRCPMSYSTPLDHWLQLCCPMSYSTPLDHWLPPHCPMSYSTRGHTSTSDDWQRPSLFFREDLNDIQLKKLSHNSYNMQARELKCVA